MVDLIVFTTEPVTVPATVNEVQDLSEVMDVLAYDEMTVLLTLTASAGAGSISVLVETALENTSDAGWAPALAFNKLAGVGTEFRATTSLLRFVRWRVAESTFTSATFTLAGLVRARERCGC